jgi:hypothetical protein
MTCKTRPLVKGEGDIIVVLTPTRDHLGKMVNITFRSGKITYTEESAAFEIPMVPIHKQELFLAFCEELKDLLPEGWKEVWELKV